MDASYKYVKDNKGIDTEKSYPYDSEDPKVTLRKLAHAKYRDFFHL